MPDGNTMSDSDDTLPRGKVKGKADKDGDKPDEKEEDIEELAKRMTEAARKLKGKYT